MKSKKKIVHVNINCGIARASLVTDEVIYPCRIVRGQSIDTHPHIIAATNCFLNLRKKKSLRKTLAVFFNQQVELYE